GRNAFPSVATIALAAGIGERAVQKVLRQLERAGYIAVQEKARRYRSTTYRLMLPGMNSGSPLTSSGGESGFTSGVNERSRRGEPAFTRGANAGSPDPSGKRQYTSVRNARSGRTGPAPAGKYGSVTIRSV